ncbi:MAG TPA: cytochrome c biogenesis protein ResB [Phycisphaerae bacterium]|nr:cytochrome c biogenesis protein ResB [Phycisphaerae bacterium]
MISLTPVQHEPRTSGSKKPSGNPPPQWPIERAVSWLGQWPKAIGRFLDRLAAHNGPVGWVVRFFSSIKMGLTWLFLTAIYIALGSGLPSLRERLDVTTLQFFDAPPMIVLMALLALTLITVTLRRIELNLYRLGVWSVHSGIITLLVGLFFYFGLKHEGMVRIFMNQTVDNYYDSTDRALYIQFPTASGSTVSTMFPLTNLPIFRAHTAANGNPLNIVIPPDQMAAISPKFGNLSVRVVGYYPFYQMAPYAVPRRPGTPSDLPVVAVNISAGGQALGSQLLVGNSPAGRVVDDPTSFGTEYLYHPSAERLAELTTNLPGSDSIIVDLPAYHFHHVYSLVPDKPIVLTGTPYTLIPRQQITMPLISQGYQGASSAAYFIDVNRTGPDGKVLQFQRVALFRYPEKSIDIFSGSQRQAVPNPIDQGLNITYFDAERDQFWIIEHNAGNFTLIQRAAGGSVKEFPIAPGQAVPVSIEGISAKFSLDQVASVVLQPELIPANQRRPQVEDTMDNCLLELAIGNSAWHSGPVYVPYQQFGMHGDLPIIPVHVPGAGEIAFVFSQLERPLPFALTLKDCQEVFYTGSDNFPRDFLSTVQISYPNTDQSDTVLIHLNHPAKVEGLSLFQARFGRDATGTAFTVLGVGNTHGFWVMLTGIVMIISGIGYAFYVKPVLQNIKKKQLAAWAAEHATEA